MRRAEEDDAAHAVGETEVVVCPRCSHGECALDDQASEAVGNEEDGTVGAILLSTVSKRTCG